MSAIEKYNICEENCNGILTRLYKKRDNISERISRAIVNNIASEALEEMYNNLVNDIEEICIWRTHHDCLIEGDAGFRFY